MRPEPTSPSTSTTLPRRGRSSGSSSTTSRSAGTLPSGTASSTSRSARSSSNRRLPMTHRPEPEPPTPGRPAGRTPGQGRLLLRSAHHLAGRQHRVRQRPLHDKCARASCPQRHGSVGHRDVPCPEWPVHQPVRVRDRHRQTTPGADTSFNLTAGVIDETGQAPSGWDITFSPSFGQERVISSISVGDALNERIDVRVTPPPQHRHRRLPRPGPRAG